MIFRFCFIFVVFFSSFFSFDGSTRPTVVVMVAKNSWHERNMVRFTGWKYFHYMVKKQKYLEFGYIDRNMNPIFNDNRCSFLSVFFFSLFFLSRNVILSSPIYLSVCFKHDHRRTYVCHFESNLQLLHIIIIIFFIFFLFCWGLELFRQEIAEKRDRKGNIVYIF